jgi:hypothetical protein
LPPARIEPRSSQSKSVHAIHLAMLNIQITLERSYCISKIVKDICTAIICTF